MKEFNLSENRRKIVTTMFGKPKYCWGYLEKDIKEFIKRLKEEVLDKGTFHTNIIIDKLAGEELK